jgi:choline dehydrogenase-like flavoprotein
MFLDALVPDTRRASLALAEAIIPGSATVPAADEALLEGAEALVRSVHPTLLRAWRAAHQVLDASTLTSRGRPFHALSAGAQEQTLLRWEQDPILRVPLSVIALVYKLCHFDRPPVYDALGGVRGAVQASDRPSWLAQIHRAEDWDGGEIECDVVVVGTGAGGAVVGKELADRGHAVVFVEEGEHYRRDAFDGSSISAHRRFYRSAFSVGNVTIPIMMGRLVGGSTAINGGTCFRTPPWVLDRWCEDLETDDFSMNAMDPAFSKVERILEIAPAGMREIGPIGEIMARGCDALGWSHSPISRNAPGCTGQGFCDFGCKTEARKGMNLSYVPAALTKGAIALTGGKVEQVRLEAGRAVGVLAVTRSGRTVKVRARAVILAGGAIPTPLLMLKQGLGLASGQVGRNLTLHPSSGFSATFDEAVRGRAHIPQGYACDQFLRDGVLLTAAQPDVNGYGVVFPTVGRRLMDNVDQIDRTACFAVLVSDDAPNGRVWRDVGGLPAITYNIPQKDADKAHSGIVHGAEMAFAAGAKSVCPVVVGAPTLKRGSSFDAFRRTRPSVVEYLWLSFHPLGTCKMGRSARTSVVDLSHEVHGVPGLYVVDGSTVPGPLGVNPQLTIMAMATRAAVKIDERLGAS